MDLNLEGRSLLDSMISGLGPPCRSCPCLAGLPHNAIRQMREPQARLQHRTALLLRRPDMLISIMVMIRQWALEDQGRDMVLMTGLQVHPQLRMASPLHPLSIDSLVRHWLSKDRLHRRHRCLSNMIRHKHKIPMLFPVTRFRCGLV